MSDNCVTYEENCPLCGGPMEIQSTAKTAGYFHAGNVVTCLACDFKGTIVLGDDDELGIKWDDAPLVLAYADEDCPRCGGALEVHSTAATAGYINEGDAVTCRECDFRGIFSKCDDYDSWIKWDYDI